MMRIRQNLAAATASRQLLGTTNTLAKSVERLSTGQRVNRAGDDAAGLVISTRLRAQASGLRQAARNAQDGISMLQTAEGALDQVSQILGRARDLSVSAANSGASSLAARQASQAEVTQLLGEVDRISATSTFGSTHLLDGSIGKVTAKATGSVAGSTVSFPFATMQVTFGGGVTGSVMYTPVAGTYSVPQIAADLQSGIRAAMGAHASAVIRDAANSFTVTATAQSGGGWSLVMEAGGLPAGANFSLSGTATWGTPPTLGFAAQTSSAAAEPGALFQVGADAGDTVALSAATFAATSSAALGLVSIDLTGSAATVAQAISSLDSAIGAVSSRRASIGAMQNRFESMIESLRIGAENSMAAESRIRDTDMAAEMVELTRSQVLAQVGTAILAQANQIHQGILSLLRV